MNPDIEGDHSLLGPYVVDALDGQEREAFEAHLAACESCRAEAIELADAVAALADAESTAPPRAMRSRVMTQISQTAQVPPPVRALGATKNKARRWPAIAAVAASLIAVAGVGIGYGTREADTASSALERDIVMLASAPDAHSMELDLGSSHVVMSDHMDEVAVMGHETPMPAEGMEYQLWFVMDDGSAVAGPTFMPDKGGDVMALADTDVSHIAAFSVTQEPRGGSTAPTGEVVASIEL